MKINLPGFKQHDPLTIMNTISKKFKTSDNKFHEILTMVYKDNRTGIKHKTEIEEPDYEFYVANPDKRVNYNRSFIPIEDAHSIICPHARLDREIANTLGMNKWFSDCIQSGNRRELKKIHMHPDIFMSDKNIEDYYRFWFNLGYENPICNITKAYFDIEGDGIEMAGDFPELGECPVNAISVVFDHTMEVYTFLLRNSSNSQIVEFEKYMASGGLEDLSKFAFDHVTEHRNLNKKIKNKSLGVENFKYHILFYDEDKEIEMISEFFALMNTKNPDIALAWNQGFDIPYMIERCKVLGYDPAHIMSHPDFKYKFAEYYIDERAYNEPAERCDFCNISSYIVYLDQLIQFASRRKGQSKYVSFSLDYIGDTVSNVKKLDYKEFTTNIAKLPYVNYKVFVFYNICDTIVQYCIENDVGDIDYVFGKVITNNTRYSKVHRQTVYLANRGMKEFYYDGYLFGNNVNIFNDPPTEKFPGAFVSDPTKVNNYSRLKLNNMPVNLFDNCDDFDYASLYPSILRQFNVAGHTQIGMIQIPDKIHDKEDRLHSEHWSRGGTFIEDFQSHVWLETASRWFNLPDYEKMVNYIKYMYMHTVRPSNMFEFENSQGTLYFPVIIQQNYQPVIFRPIMSDNLQNQLKEWTDYVAQFPNQQFQL